MRVLPAVGDSPISEADAKDSKSGLSSLLPSNPAEPFPTPTAVPAAAAAAAPVGSGLLVRLRDKLPVALLPLPNGVTAPLEP